MRRDPRLWIVPKIWPNGECFILGGGPSLRDFDINLLKGRRIIAVNNAYKLANWIDVVFFGDKRWYYWEVKGLLEFAGLKVTDREEHLDKPGIKVVRRRNSPWGISRDPGILTWNLSSGACAINLAVHFGVKRIILLGFDMKKEGNRHNYHDDYPKDNNPKRDPYKRFMSPFPFIANDLKNMNIECLNANPDSALTVFPKVKLEEILCSKSLQFTNPVET